MKRLGIALMVLVLALFLAGAALAGAPNLTGTTWTGTISYAGAPLNFFASDEISITILLQDDFGNFYGTLTNNPVFGGSPIHPLTGNVSIDKTVTTCTLTPNNFPGEIAISTGKLMDNKMSATAHGFSPDFVYTGSFVLTKQE